MRPGKVILYLVAVGLLVAIFLVAWFKRGYFESAQELADVTKPEIIKIHKHPQQGYVHYLTIEGWGEVAGEAEISLIEEGRPYRTEKLSGSIRFQWNTEWYADTAELRYSPSSVTNGTVWLRYRFKDQRPKPARALRNAVP